MQRDRSDDMDVYKLRVCRALLSHVGLDRLWDAQGPTVEAMALRRRGRGRELPQTARIIFLVVWSLWEPREIHLPWQAVLPLRPREMELVCSVMYAWSTGDPIAWLERYEFRPYSQLEGPIPAIEESRWSYISRRTRDAFDRLFGPRGATERKR